MKKTIFCLDFIVATAFLVLFVLSRLGKLSADIDNIREAAFSVYLPLSLICHIIMNYRDSNENKRAGQ